MSKKKMPRKRTGPKKKNVAGSYGAAIPPTKLGDVPIHTWDFLPETLGNSARLNRDATGWYFNSSLVLESAGSHIARFAFDPVGTGLKGLLVEPAATNSIRNSSAGGAAAGTPGSLPTNWSITGVISNLARTIVGTGVEDGIPYIDIQISGTPNTSSSTGYGFDTSMQIPALAGQTWTSSCYVRLVGGSLTNVQNLFERIYERDAGGAIVTTDDIRIGPTSAALRTQRAVLSRTLTGGATAYVQAAIVFGYTHGLQIGGSASGFTMRIGLPQLVQAATATSPIVTTSGAVTRTADVLSLALPNGAFSIDFVRTSGTTTMTNQVVTTGSFVVPTDISPLQRVIATRTS